MSEADKHYYDGRAFSGIRSEGDGNKALYAKNHILQFFKVLKVLIQNAPPARSDARIFQPHRANT